MAAAQPQSWAKIVGSKEQSAKQLQSVKKIVPKRDIQPEKYAPFGKNINVFPFIPEKFDPLLAQKIKAKCEAIKKQITTIDPNSKPHPKLGSIINSDGFDYLYTGSYYEVGESILQMNPTRMEDFMVSDGMFAIEYCEDSPNYMYCVALFKHNGKYWRIPESHSTFSLQGTIDPDREWQIVSEPLNYRIGVLPIKVCRAECPGYLDC